MLSTSLYVKFRPAFGFFFNNGLRQVNCYLYKVKSDLIIYLNPLPYVQRIHIHKLDIQSMKFLCTDDGSYMDQRNFEIDPYSF